MSKTKIQSTEQKFPQIYAYTLPEYPKKTGWVKIGYTDRQDVDVRILEQTKNAAINEPYNKLWFEPAFFPHNAQRFFDKDLHAYLRKHKHIEQEKGTEWFYYNGTPMQSHVDFLDFIGRDYSQVAKESQDYQLRKEQEDAVEQTLAYFQQTPNGEFLWNAKPRFGKTLTTYDLARRLDCHNVLIVTNRPAIANSWFDDFEKFIAWQTDFAFVSTSDSLKERSTINREEFLEQYSKEKGKKRMLAFISLQDLKGAIAFGGNYDKLAWVKEMQWDLLVIDEAHEGVDTFKTDIAFNNLTRKHTLHLSGTPFKAIASREFSQEEIYNWSYADEQAAKANWSASNEQNNPYENLPQLNLFSYQMSQMLTDNINQGAQINGETYDYAFDLNEFFATNDKGKFIYEKEVKKWLETLRKNEKYPFSIYELRDELKHTLWLLDRVASAKALYEILRKDEVFENYEIILAAGDGKTESDQQANKKALDRVKSAVKNHKKTITLSVGQLTTGITIPEWTAVLMLSNMKSPAQYMQAAFRAQNPWSYVEKGKTYQKKNAYVFDFAPERTLIIYDEFANNLSNRTANGGGTTEDRKQNIKELLNFFPVIAEDSQGKMIELDVNQVLTLPKAIKAQEVVRRGFMSNLLFQNISGLFASDEVRQILEQLAPVEEGKNVPTSRATAIDTQGVQLDENGEVVVNQNLVISTTNAHFGEKIYQEIQQQTEQALENSPSQELAQNLAKTFVQQTAQSIKDIAKQQGVNEKTAERIVQQQAQELSQKVVYEQAQAQIKQKEAEAVLEKIKQNTNDSQVIAEAEQQFETQKAQINQDLQQRVQEVVKEQAETQIQAAVQQVYQQAEEIKKTQVEDDIRDRLRGFARTIPSFLMAFGKADTALSNFDQIVPDEVFQEVTGISLAQFRILRDQYQFFDEIVFNESAQEFLQKRTALANYFDESQREDIFDYIPPQKTNQIFTPKAVVNLMLDKMEQEEPQIFKNQHRTFADLYMKSGLYLTEIVKRLYQGLRDEIPDNQARLKHILENQIYGFAPSEIIYNIAKNFIFNFDQQAQSINPKHIICLDTVPYAMGEQDFQQKLKELFGEENMKFDAIVGNPPYQENNEDNSRDNPIYHYFYDLAEKVSDKYSLISPARFLFNAGQTPKEWNKKMLEDEHLKVVYFTQKSTEIFPPPTDIKGGGSSIVQKCQGKIWQN